MGGLWLLPPRHCWHSWISTNRHRTGNQIDHFAFSSRFSNCLLDVRNKRGADISLEMDHRLKIAYLRLHVASATSRKVGVVRPPSSPSTIYIIQLSLANGKGILLIRWQRLTNSPENIDENWAVSKNVLFSDAS